MVQEDNLSDIDEGAESKVGAKHMLRLYNTPGNRWDLWDLCDIPQSLPAALKLRKGENKWLTNSDHSPARPESLSVI